MSMVEVASVLNNVVQSFGYFLHPKTPAGKLDKKSGHTLYKMYPLEEEQQPPPLLGVLCELGASNIRYLDKAEPVSKFPGYQFSLHNAMHLVLFCDHSRGEWFERAMFDALTDSLNNNPCGEFQDLVRSWETANPAFNWDRIQSFSKGKSNGRKGCLTYEEIGAVLSDYKLYGSDRSWGVSLKENTGKTISSHYGAASLFDPEGTLCPNSKGAAFLISFGVDLNQVQAGFDLRNGITKPRPNLYTQSITDSAILKPIFRRAWGVNYFYTRKKPFGWNTFWVDEAKQEELSSGIIVHRIRYPDETNKSILIEAGNQKKRYIIEMRNSAKGEYPNDIKFKVKR